ncbi:MAG: heme-binding protein [Actinomycetota bacterium]|nr:heme-binding protein [Actinomycetota bacterium]
MYTACKLTLEDAIVLLQAAEQEAVRQDVKQTICIVDDGGHVIALHRMTGARLTGVEIAMAKAFTAAGHERATHVFNEPPNGPALPGNEAFGISHMLPGRFAIFVGGFPIVHEGRVIGAVGVSGGVGAQDKAVGAAALAAFEQLAAAQGAEG